MTLDGLKDAADGLLTEGVRDRQSPWQHVILANGAGAGAPQLRMLVLRAWDAPARRATLHTDRRSTKMAALRPGAAVALLGWDPGRRIQLRLAGRVDIAGAPETAAIWAGLAPHSRATYATALSPGTPIGSLDAQPPRLTEAAAEAAFTVLTVTVETLDWLRLTHGGQERARLTWADGRPHATWVAP